MLDRFGAIRLSPQGVALDSSKDVPWSKVTAVHTRPLIDVMTVSAVERATQQVTRFLPPIPGAKSVTGWAADKVADLLLSLFLVVLADYGERATSVQIPTGILYKGFLWRKKSMTAGFFSTAVLALPKVSESLLATARGQDVPLYALPSQREHGSALEAAQAVRDRINVATQRLELRRGRVGQDLSGDALSDPTELS